MTEAYADDDHRYLLESRIATGGMGEVWRARDLSLDRPVAVKILREDYAHDRDFRDRFATESRHAAALQHPGIAAIHDSGSNAPTPQRPYPRPWLVMELVEGRPLSSVLRTGVPLDPAAVTHLLKLVAQALGSAHANGIVHRDVKPANLLVTADRSVKVTDFGIARAADGLALTQPGAVMGTPQYLSPEQAEGNRATPASDVYSLAVVGFECLAGRRPFRADTPLATAIAHLRHPIPDLPDHVPPPLAAVIKQGLAKDPALRFPDGAAFAAALHDPEDFAIQSAAGGTEPSAHEPEPTPSGTEHTANRPRPEDTIRDLWPTNSATGQAAAREPATERSTNGHWILWAIIALAVLALLALVAVLAYRGLSDADGATGPIIAGVAAIAPLSQASTPRWTAVLVRKPVRQRLFGVSSARPRNNAHLISRIRG